MNKSWFDSLWYWRLAFFECCSDMFIIGATTLIASLANSDWKQMNGTARFTIILCTVMAMVKVLKSNLSTTIQTLKDNQPIPEGTTVQQQVTTTQVTQASLPVVTVPTTVPVQQPPLGPK